jgi:hypothetical protein
MAKLAKSAPWLNLSAGLVWTLLALSNFFGLGFLKISTHPHTTDPFLALVQLFTGIIYLWLAAAGLLNARRNPEGKPEPVVRTLLGPQ